MHMPGARLSSLRWKLRLGYMGAAMGEGMEHEKGKGEGAGEEDGGALWNRGAAALLVVDARAMAGAALLATRAAATAQMSQKVRWAQMGTHGTEATEGAEDTRGYRGHRGHAECR